MRMRGKSMIRIWMAYMVIMTVGAGLVIRLVDSPVVTAVTLGALIVAGGASLYVTLIDAREGRRCGVA